jgi:hypothetical protein
MKRSAILLSGLLLAGTLRVAGTLRAADAAGPRMSSPVLGYVFDDSAEAIRAISGVPGAASLGATVSLPSALVSAFVHSSGTDAVALTKEGTVAYVSWNGNARLVALETALASLTQAAFSGSGRIAISDGFTIEVWLAGAVPALVSRYHADAPVSALAVNNDGGVIAAAGSSLVRFSDRGAEVLASGTDWAAIAFSNDGLSVTAADATHQELVKIGADGGRTVIASLAERASAIVASQDGSFLVALPTSLLSVSAAGAVSAIGCDCEPKGLDSLQGTSTAFVRGTQLLLDASGSEPQLTRLPSLYPVNDGGAN